MAEHARQQTRRPALAARQGGAHRLLGVFVHQLPTRHPARRRLVPGLQRQRPRFRGDRRAHPEYAFEKVTGNVEKGAADLGITYPIALDNGYSTWTNYRNRYWPAEYLIDANGVVRHIKFGEGDYTVTERLIRQLLTDADPGVRLPRPSTRPISPQAAHHPETYLGVGKVVNYAGGGYTTRAPPHSAIRRACPRTASR
ncbi:dipZ domain protein [Mycobacterium xenopi 4042]|uniref:DipZ domain protein n=1 Tax=Mycobacterium xenopi 4042 TaxID=1299334 RepID=X8EVU9_MYCXE|nr:dipZ domain protein [Mycobacterium xenopi 4042]